MFSRVLIANRSEIACRIARTVKRMGASAVGIYSWPERTARHVEAMDEAFELPGSEPVAAYLNIESIVNIAKQARCQAVHPGYGFLSENHELPKTLLKAGIAFIGPSAECMQALGNKVSAKQLAEKSKVPLAASLNLSGNDSSKLEQAQSFAKQNGYPFLIKAAAGGGGRGMRLVRSEQDLVTALAQAAREAQLAFADSQLFCEQLIEKARHIEVQFLADQHKNTFIFFDRDCSTQRQHQKVIEEAPAPGLSAETRSKLYEYTRALAKASNYSNAGTAEFLLDQKQQIYFLEVNSRLQVEHPISELITSYDLVELQIRVAANENLAKHIKLATVPPSDKHAIELRLCAELPQKNFMPTNGQISSFVDPSLSNLRIDSGIQAGSRVLPYFDSLLAKIISVGDSRAEVIQQLGRALEVVNPVGIETNSAFLSFILSSAEFQNCQQHTDFLKELNFEKHYPLISKKAAALAVFARTVGCTGNFQNHIAFRLGSAARFNQRLYHQGASYTLQLQVEADATCRILDDNDVIVGNFKLLQNLADRLAYQDVSDESMTKYLMLTEISQKLWLSCEFGSFCFDLCDPRAALRQVNQAFDTRLFADLPGKIIKLPFQPGMLVTKGQVVVVMESMKMEHSLYAPADGILEKVHIIEGQQVDANTLLVEFRLTTETQQAVTP